MIKEMISKIVEGKNLTKDEANEVFNDIMNGQATDAQIGSFLTALRMKGETIDEIQGAAESMRSVSSRVTYNGKENVLDVVGTGGDKKKTFNISTASAIVAAGTGCVVAKHGNRSVSSQSGSADVLESLGVNIETTPQRNSEILNKIGFAFLYAPKHHLAMKYAIGARKEIGIRTIFNILGPITNPARPNTFLLGAYNVDLAEKLAFVLAGLKAKKAFVVHGSGYDEITLTGKTIVFDVEKGKVEKIEITPEKFGFKKCKEKDLEVHNPTESSEIIMKILSGKEKGPKLDAVLLNAGFAIYANGKAKNPKDGIELARRSIESGKAKEKLEQLIAETKKA
ncbi:MAG TPA: anthranilate phosphoribosyltransferase [archaeon]|nr:anthranilate phosphoribosyltransferase [archaeon]